MHSKMRKTMKYYIYSENLVSLNHYWEKFIGSCHASAVLHADYRGQQFKG